ncbi:MAG: four helix bundle protein [Terriglobales bacterium]
MAGHFKQLSVWRKGIDLADAIYIGTETFPKHETFGLSSQMRRAAVSIPSNIAEGQAHHSHADFIRFLRLARGSLAELQTQVVIAGRREYLKRDVVKKLWKDADEINRMINGLIAATQKQMKISEPE